MIFEIKYYESLSDNLISLPQYDRSEFVESLDGKTLDPYITSKSDSWGNKYKREKAFGFDYTSRNGEVKVVPINVRKI